MKEEILEELNIKEDNERECKLATGGLPESIWETYSSFANTNGGTILLGIREYRDSFTVEGLTDKQIVKYQKDFWSTLNDRNKVSKNILLNHHVRPVTVGEKRILRIDVPAADRHDKPVYIGTNPMKGTYKRDYEGDFLCAEEAVRAMFADQRDVSGDVEVLEEFGLDVLNQDTIKGYRIIFEQLHSGHPWNALENDEFLMKLRAAAKNKAGTLSPTIAGLLFFGEAYHITEIFPNYFLDYRAELDPAIRWTDRVFSSSGDWSGNIFDFYFRVYNKLKQSLTVPFKLSGVTRIDDTPMHEAIREALANCLVNADYFGSRGIVVILRPDQITFANPGYSRTGKLQMMRGGVSDPRNRGLMKMFNLVDIGERAGSGIPKIMNIWNDEGMKEPVITEEFDPDRTILTLSLEKKQAIKTSDNAPVSSSKAKKTLENQRKILEYLKDHGRSKCSDIAAFIGLSEARTRVILLNMPEVEVTGANRYRTYRIK